MKCPKCESENTQRLEVIFHGGTQDINTTSKTAGGGIGGAFGIGGAVTKTSGQSQSLLAQKATPPAKKGLMWAGLFAFLGLINAVASLNHLQIIAMLFSVLMFLAGAYVYKANLKFNKDEWPKLYQHWLDSWLCNKCGAVYHQA